MKKVQQSYLGFVSMALVLGATFAACGGLDARKVSRGPEEGSEKGGEGNDPTPGAGGSENSAGGSDNAGGGDSSPFGGDKGYEGGAPPVVDGPPTVVEISPGADAEDAEPNDDVGLRFSEALDPETVTLDNIKILDGDTEVDGELSYQGIDALFEPTRRLSLLTTYDVSVSTGVTDAGGNAMTEPFTSKFTVRDGKWASIQEVYADDGLSSSYEQQAAIDGRGNMLVVWTKRADQMDYTWHVWARWYRLSGGWQEPVQLDAAPTDNSGISYPAVAVSPEGDAVVAWFQYDGVSQYHTMARRYFGGQWEASAQPVDSTSGVPFHSMRGGPAVAIGAGRVMISWAQIYSGTIAYEYHLGANAPVDGEWTSQIGASNYGASGQSLDSVNATITSEGTALATVNQSGTPVSPDATYGPGINFLRVTSGGTWTNGRIVGSLPGGPVNVKSAGDGAVAVWTDYNSTTQKYQLLASRYTRAKGFTAPVPIQDPELTQDINLDQTGALASNAASIWAGWSQGVGSNQNAYVSRFDVVTGKWDAVPTLVSSGEANAMFVKVATDPHGNALVAFTEQGTSNSYVLSWSRYSVAAESWSGAKPLSSDETGEPISIAAADNGVAMLLYRRYAGGEQYTGGLAAYFK